MRRGPASLPLPARGRDELCCARVSPLRWRLPTRDAGPVFQSQFLFDYDVCASPGTGVGVRHVWLQLQAPRGQGRWWLVQWRSRTPASRQHPPKREKARERQGPRSPCRGSGVLERCCEVAWRPGPPTLRAARGILSHLLATFG